MAVALLCTTSIAGCSRSVTLPPLVDDQDAPQIPGKFVWHNLVTIEDADGALLHLLFSDHGDVFYSAPMDRYGHGFYGHP